MTETLSCDLREDGVHAPAYSGPHAGIRCLHCNAKITPDPRVATTARHPSPNTEATGAALNARGIACRRCGVWTMRPVRVMTQGGIPTATETDDLCRNCTGLGNGLRQEAKIWSAHRYGGGEPIGDSLRRPDPRIVPWGELFTRDVTFGDSDE